MIEKAEKIDLGKYMGKWYQLAAFPAWFQRGCKNVTARYTDKGAFIQVINSCTSKGTIKKQEGKAFLTDKENVLKVQFFAPFQADYIIEFVDKDYKYAIVGSQGKKYLWILSRQPWSRDGRKRAIQEQVFDELVAIAKRKKYDVSRLDKDGIQENKSREFYVDIVDDKTGKKLATWKGTVTRKTQSSGRFGGDVREVLFVRYHQWKRANEVMKQATFDELQPEYLKDLAKRIRNHFAFTNDKGLMIENARVMPLFRQAKPFDNWPVEKQKIIMEQLEAEDESGTVNDYIYCFTTFTEAELPMSYWERVFLEFENVITAQRRYALDIGITNRTPRHFNKIIALERAIIDQGFSENFPILIRGYYPNDDLGRISIDGGNHRVQAVRNLIKAGKLPADFQIPAVCRFMISDKWKLVNKRSKSRKK